MNIAICFTNSFYSGFALCDTAEKINYVLSSISGDIMLKGFSSPEAAYRYACYQFFTAYVKQQENLDFYLPRMEDMMGTNYIYTTNTGTMSYFPQQHLLAGIFEDNVVIATSPAMAAAFMKMYPLAYMQVVNSPEAATYLLNAWSLRNILPLRAYLSEQPMPRIKNIKLDTVWSTGIKEWYQRNLQLIPKTLQLQRMQVVQRVSDSITK
ncbi:MAG: hypothetical protein LKI76_04345 [Megasphaera sp.]|jgi:hypothetical protein|nr:hypothetical protein [Megasphaera sp.]